MPRCSVVIPVRDMARYVGDAVASVLAQTAGDLELVVVDDASSDGSADVARAVRDPRLRVEALPRAVGAPAARNRGAALRTTPMILFLDADDRLLPDALERLAGALDRDPDLSLAYGEAVVIDAEGRAVGTGGPPLLGRRPSGDVSRRVLRTNFIVTTGAACLRRAAFDRAGPFLESLLVSQDWELWCRVARTGPFRYVGGAPVVEYRSHAGSVTAARLALSERNLPAIEAAFSHPEVRARFGEAELRRLRMAGSHAHAGRGALKARRWTEARRHLAASLRRDPLQPREAVLFLCALLRRLPGPLLRRLK